MKHLKYFESNTKGIIKGTLSFWKGKWIVSYTTIDGDQGLDLYETQVGEINIYKDYINKRRGVDVEFYI